jgi:dihydroorotate dehydrogenase
MIGAPASPTYGEAVELADGIVSIVPSAEETPEFSQIKGAAKRNDLGDELPEDLNLSASFWAYLGAYPDDDPDRERFRAQGLDLARRLGFSVPLYDSLQEYADNEVPPFSIDDIYGSPAELPANWELMGHQIGLPIGLPASVLTRNRAWISVFSKLGFNVFTYKTVRSSANSGNIERPNWLFADPDLPQYYPDDVVERQNERVVGGERLWPRSLERFSTLNSFGVPSPPPDVWMADVASLAGDLTEKKQLLIVSVVGDYEHLYDDSARLTEDFVRVSEMAAEAEAPAIELNLSCPNHGVNREPICKNPALTLQIVRAVRKRIPSRVNLGVKLSYLSREELESTILPVLPYVDAVAGVNTLQVLTKRPEDDRPAFKGTEVAGLSGYAIFPLARDFVIQLDEIRRERRASFDIIATGGVMTAEHAAELYRLGADCIQSTSAANFNPRLAGVCADLFNEEGAFYPKDVADMFGSDSVASEVLDVLRKYGGTATMGELISRTSYPPRAIEQAVEMLELTSAVVTAADEDKLRGPRYRIAS